MAQIETWIRTDIKKPVEVQVLKGNVFSADNMANLIGVEVYDNGEPYALSGTVTASIIRGDGGTVSASGSFSGNRASVVLPAAAYVYPGIITVAVKVTSGSVVTTIGAVVGNVYQSSTDTIVDPGTVIPNINELIAEIEAAIASIPADYTNLWATIAPPFSTSANYLSGQYATYNAKLWRFISDHSAGSWDSSHVIEAAIGPDVYDFERYWLSYINKTAIPVNGIVHQDGWDTYQFGETLKPGKYTLLLNVSSSETNDERLSKIRFTTKAAYNTTALDFSGVTRDTDHHVIFDLPKEASYLHVFASLNSTASAGKTLAVNKIAVYHGEVISKDENFDCSEGIKYMFDEYGNCDLDEGVYTAKKPIVMPAKSSLTGRFESTQLLLAATADKSFSASNVDGESFIGFTNESESWSGPYPAGVYRIKANISTESEANPRVKFCKSQNYSAANVIYDFGASKDTDAEGFFYVNEPVKSIFVFGGVNSTYTGPFTINSLEVELCGCAICMGDHSTVHGLEILGSATDIQLSATMGNRFAMLWNGNDERHYGIVDNCRIHGFDLAGILGEGTGTPVDSGMMITNCGIYNNHIGIYHFANCEYNKIANCVISGNYYGYYNRGGNNVMANCGVDGNVVGIRVDNQKGTNNGHGNIAGCTINHSDSNNGYGLIINGTGRMLVSNCNFYYSDILLENTNGNVIANCGFGNLSEIEIKNGGCSIIEGCMMRSQDNTITLTGNTTSKVLNCFDRNGNAIVPVTGA